MTFQHRTDACITAYTYGHVTQPVIASPMQMQCPQSINMGQPITSPIAYASPPQVALPIDVTPSIRVHEPTNVWFKMQDSNTILVLSASHVVAQQCVQQPKALMPCAMNLHACADSNFNGVQAQAHYGTDTYRARVKSPMQTARTCQQCRTTTTLKWRCGGTLCGPCGMKKYRKDKRARVEDERELEVELMLPKEWACSICDTTETPKRRAKGMLCNACGQSQSRREGACRAALLLLSTQADIA